MTDSVCKRIMSLSSRQKLQPDRMFMARQTVYLSWSDLEVQLGRKRLRQIGTTISKETSVAALASRLMGPAIPDTTALSITLLDRIESAPLGHILCVSEDLAKMRPGCTNQDEVTVAQVTRRQG
jgi:predicted anti-sigma-YlaC factor YlaD